MKTVLHAGCANTPIPDYLAHCKETRLDADDLFKPDIVAPIYDLGDIGPFDIAYCSHTLEHVYPYQVIPALQELLRVTNGHVIIIVPDLEGITIGEQTLYMCGDYPVTAMDMFYGTATPTNPWMGHKCGFTQKLLQDAFRDAGYIGIDVTRIPNYQLLAVGSKTPLRKKT